ncbi:hypothetical protein KPH14_001470 [Odynerus spinipes]|uniref:Uncharacterized protein n=1 Tax=Odynerus spinipes TaxID=1348599 RepID=A0AAD9RUR0_9HYME|nr:hypothetical protein KPH14_001470 [Odynerus spinipes]
MARDRYASLTAGIQHGYLKGQLFSRLVERAGTLSLLPKGSGSTSTLSKSSSTLGSIDLALARLWRSKESKTRIVPIVTNAVP